MKDGKNAEQKKNMKKGRESVVTRGREREMATGRERSDNRKREVRLVGEQRRERER